MAQPDSLLLFYRAPISASDGVVVTGRLDEFGNYRDLQTHTGFEHWLDIVPADTATGLVLFHESGTRRAVAGQVGTDGSYVDLKNLTDLPFSPVVVATREGFLIFYQSASENGVGFGIAQTGKLLANGDFVPKSEPRRLDLWSHVVPTVNGLVLFSLADQGTAATVRISPEGALTDLKGFTGFDPWTHIVSTSDGILLFYNGGTGAAVTGRIDEEGNYTDLRNTTLDRGWSHIVPTTNGLVLFYRATSSPEAVVGRINPESGAFNDVSVVNGLERWSRIVSVLSLPPITGKV